YPYRQAVAVLLARLAATARSPLPLHDALPICPTTDRGTPVPGAGRAQGRRHEARAGPQHLRGRPARGARRAVPAGAHPAAGGGRSEEHTSELQSREKLVCRLLLEKKKKRAATR